MKKIKIGLLLTALIMISLGPTKVRANRSDCYTKMNKEAAVSIGDTFTYDLGIGGPTTDTYVYGLHYVIMYDQDVLEPISVADGGVGSYYKWENITSNVYEDKVSFNKLVVDIKTDDKSKYLDDNTDTRDLLKIGYVKFKVKNTKSTSTRIILYQTYKEDLIQGSFYNSSSSYYYSYNNYSGYKQSPCYTDITTYINLYNKDSDATLKSLKVKETNITPEFNKNTLNYKAEVLNEIDTINIEAICSGKNCQVKGAGEQKLQVGDNTFNIEVISESGSSQTYTIKINRKEKVEAYLKELSIKNNKLSPEFNPETLEYLVFVASDIEKLDLSYLANDTESKVKITGNDKFVIGNNLVEIIVTNNIDDVTVERKYHLNVIKEALEDTTLMDNNKKIIEKQQIIIIIISSILLISNIIWIIKVVKMKRSRN